MACLIIGCAAGGDPGDGGSNLPERGFAGYMRVLDADEMPIEPMPKPDDGALGDPFARVIDGRVELYVSRCIEGTTCAIVMARSDDGKSFDTPTPIADDPAGLTAPYVFDRTLFAVVGDGEAITAIDLDSGDRETVLTADGARLGSPSVVPSLAPSGGPWLYVTRETDQTHAVMRTPLGEDALEAVELPGDPDGWDPPATLGPELRRATTGAGRTIYRMAYAGRPSGGNADLAFAASFDGSTFSNWPFDPALDGDADESAPSNIRFGQRYLLYYARGRGHLGVAERVADNPTEDF